MKQCLACQTPFVSPGWKCPSCGHEPPLQQDCRLFAPKQRDSTAGYDPERHALVAEVESGHFWFRTRAQVIAWAFREYFGSSGNYLEVGCGTGFVMEGLRKSLPNLSMVGSEILLEGVMKARRRLPDVEFIQMDMMDIPYQGEFDVLGAYDVIEHVQDDLGALHQFAKALKDQGGLILTVPQHPSLWSRHDERAHHVRRYTARELKNKVQEAGFQVVRMTSLYCSTLPLMWWARRSDPGPAAKDTGFHLPAGLNPILYGMLQVERAAIRAGLDLPAGGSLLLIAQKR